MKLSSVWIHRAAVIVLLATLLCVAGFSLVWKDLRYNEAGAAEYSGFKDYAVVTVDSKIPKITSFKIPAKSSSLTVTITSFTATDNVGVTGYLVKESSSKPTADAAEWGEAPPVSYTFSSVGKKTLYAWVKDAAGNVSARRSAGVTIKLPGAIDKTAPVVTGFGLPVTFSSLTVPITFFTATDNVGVTGYLVKENSLRPSASPAGWSAAPPASYTFASAGKKRLYAWAKDAAGNVSARKSANTTITSGGNGGSAGITGTVRDIVSGSVVSGAVISDGTHSATSDSSGVYTLNDPSGNYTLSVTKTGYLTTYQTATVSSTAAKTVDWALTKTYGKQAIPATSMQYVIFAWNDLGMHCDQDDYSYFGVLPPYNTLHVQVFQRGGEGARLIRSGITVSYTFPKKTNSALHTNFWTYAPQFGWNVPTNVGITGTPLSGDMSLDANGLTWEAAGIPITPYDDDGTWDPYGTAVITVKDNAGSVLQTVNIVAPVSTEMMCSNCHGTNNPQLDILQRHDAHSGTSFVAEQAKGTVHLCSECHSDNALGMPGKPGVPSLSLAMHDFHKDKLDYTPQSSNTSPGCYNCHPGTKTQCLRGIMARAGKSCEDCHGTIAQVSGSIQNGRQPWLQEPRCGDCHDALHVENSNALYRNSFLMNSPEGDMNGIISCEACHNGPHAELTTTVAADAAVSQKYQGDSYWIWNCGVCHGGSSGRTMHSSRFSSGGGG